MQNAEKVGEYEFDNKSLCVECSIKVHIYWEDHKILRNLHLTFDWHYIGQK